MVKKKAQAFPHDALEMIVFDREFPDLADAMSSPFRTLARESSRVAGDALFAVAQSQGDPVSAMAGVQRVLIDNLESIPNLAKTFILGNMNEEIKEILSNAPPIPEDAPKE